MIKPRTTPKEQVLNIDIAPTMLEMAGVAVPKENHGRSMVPVLQGNAKDWRKDWLYEYYEYPQPHRVPAQRGVRSEKWKLIHYFEQKPEEFELYDLEKDPKEMVNLYGKPEYEEVAKQLKVRIADLRRETGDLPK